MSFFDIFRISKIKSDLRATQQECDKLKQVLSETDRMDHFQLSQAIAELRRQHDTAAEDLTRARSTAESEIAESRNQRDRLESEIAAKKKELIVLDDELLLQSFGIYTPRYQLANSEAYKKKLDQVRGEQERCVKSGLAATCPTAWTVNNSKAEGDRMIRDYTKLIVRSFNNECDASIVRVKFNNIEAIEKKIVKAFEVLNKLAKRMSIAITNEYLELKRQELHLVYEYELKKQEEKEEQKRLREQMREEAKAMREIEELKQKLQKEERHFQKALTNLSSQIEQAGSPTERQAYEKERDSILRKLQELGHTREDIIYREQNTRAGYVYVVSNVGSFGEGVYKIGVTRRFDPVERVDELGDASVPFDFDIHALIFSDNAPTLENALHKAFQEGRLNRINLRREFFRVSLDDIERVVKENFQKPVEFTRIAEAAEFRQSALLKAKV